MFIHLPFDLFILILKFCDTITLSKCIRVSKLFYRTIKSHPRMVKHWNEIHRKFSAIGNMKGRKMGPLDFFVIPPHSDIIIKEVN